MEPVRVAHCMAGLSHGGYESLVMSLYRCIDRERLQFDFISSFSGVYEEEIEALGGRIHRIPFITQKGPFVYTRQLDRVLAEHPEYTIVHSHMDKFSGLVMARAKKAGVPVRIAHSHNTQNEGGLAFQLVKDHYGRMVLPNATHLFACSEAAARWMFGEKAGEARILKNGVDPEKFRTALCQRRAVREELHIAPDAPVFGHVGRFTPQKNHRYLLDIFAAVHAFDKSAVLLLIGTGPLLEEMQKKAEALGLEGCVKFLGARQDIPRLLAGMDGFLFPSLHEGLPVTLVEAQASGLPILASTAITPEVCVTDLVQQIKLSDPPEAWAKAALTAAKSRTGRRECPEEALRRAGYDIHDTAQKLQDFYLELAAHSRRLKP